MDSILALPSLIKAIKQNNPTGKDLRKEDFARSLYHKIKDARTAARALERQQIQGAEIVNKPDWTKVYEFSLQALTTQTKDLEIAVWLIEALLREHGFAGLQTGFTLIRELISAYWDNLYPLPDEDGLITRLAPLAGLNGVDAEGTLIVPMALVSLTQGYSVGPFSLWQYQQALEIIKITDPDRRNQKLAAGAVTLEMIAQAAAETQPEFFQVLLHDLNKCIDEFNKLVEILEQKAGQDAPPSSRILAQLNACVDCIKVIAKDNISIATKPSKNPTKERSLADMSEANVLLTANAIINSQIQTGQDLQQVREQILKSILSAADFFKRTEPHSPVPYLLERAVKWSKQPLPILLKELIKDEQAFGHFCNLTGVIAEG
jgi:type VI secretion system protein ImpA